MPKAKVKEEETPLPEEEEPPAQDKAPEAPPPVIPETVIPETVVPETVVPETPIKEAVPKPKAKSKAKAKTRALKQKEHFKDDWSPGEVTIPQPPALLRQPEPEIPQLTQAQALRLHLATAAQERRAQAHMRIVTPIRQFYGL